MGEYLTIPKIARALGKADNTARRHIRSYANFFKPELVDSYEQFPKEETLEVLRAIIKISSAGKRKPEVIAELKEMGFEELRQVDDDYEVEIGSDLESGVMELGPETMDVFREISASLKILAERKGVEKE